MENIVDQYHKYRNRKAIFAVTHLFGWYDGPTSGVAKLIDFEEFYYFETIAIDFKTPLRIYGILKINPWTDQLQALSEKSDLNLFIAAIEQYSLVFSGKTYLFQAANIDALEYKLIMSESNDLFPIKNFEDVANQDEKENQKWFKLFA